MERGDQEGPHQRQHRHRGGGSLLDPSGPGPEARRGRREARVVRRGDSPRRRRRARRFNHREVILRRRERGRRRLVVRPGRQGRGAGQHIVPRGGAAVRVRRGTRDGRGVGPRRPRRRRAVASPSVRERSGDAVGARGTDARRVRFLRPERGMRRAAAQRAARGDRAAVRVARVRGDAAWERGGHRDRAAADEGEDIVDDGERVFGSEAAQARQGRV
mmetsp:Transcript_10841/g.43688  ORF Transcript_10841/g.43688 Transcript_10841/m.43688 type:complete len:217 (+) Transcript_10841:1062-1712(+)